MKQCICSFSYLTVIDPSVLGFQRQVELKWRDASPFWKIVPLQMNLNPLCCEWRVLMISSLIALVQLWASFWLYCFPSRNFFMIPSQRLVSSSFIVENWSSVDIYIYFDLWFIYIAFINFIYILKLYVFLY